LKTRRSLKFYDGKIKQTTQWLAAPSPPPGKGR